MDGINFKPRPVHSIEHNSIGYNSIGYNSLEHNSLEHNSLEHNSCSENVQTYENSIDLDPKISLVDISNEMDSEHNRFGEYTGGVYLPHNNGIATSDDQEAFLSVNLDPADIVGKDHGYPVEDLMGGDCIPLPYSSSDSITTNEDLFIND